MKKKKIIGEDVKDYAKDIPKVLVLPEEKNSPKESKKAQKRADFLKLDNLDKYGTHGFSNKLNITKGGTIFDKEEKDVSVRIPVSILSFISFEFDLYKDIQSKLTKAFKCVKDVKIENGVVYAVVDGVIKANDLPMSILSKSGRTMDEYVSTDNIPEEIKHLTYSAKDPIRLKNRDVYIEMNIKAIIAKFILDDMGEVGNNIIDISEMSSVKFNRRKIYFALTFNDEHDGSIFINSKNVIAMNISMTQQKFEELSSEMLQTIRTGSSTKFVRTSDIVSRKTRGLVYSRSNVSEMIRNPIIELVEVPEYETLELKKKNAKPLLMFDQVEIPYYLKLMGTSNKKTPNDKTVKKLFGKLFDDEPVYYRDGSNNIFLCPNIKKFALFTIFENIEAPFKVGVKTNVNSIAIALEAIK